MSYLILGSQTEVTCRDFPDNLQHILCLGEVSFVSQIAHV